MSVNQWIMVTGVPRSGSTFVGKVLSAPFVVDYVHEPFNPECGIPGLTRRYVYARPHGAVAAQLRPEVERLLAYRAHLKTGIFRNDGSMKVLLKRLVGSRGPFYYRLARLNPFSCTAVLKDPVGCLLTEFLADEFGVKPVIILRHPVAFVASVIRLGWTWEVDLSHLREQPELVADHFADEPAFLAAEWNDPIERAAACWRALHKVMLAQAARHPDWVVLTHEAISADPVAQFRRLYDRFRLPWSPRIERMILAMTSSSNPGEARAGRASDFRRDSSGLLALRMRHLTAEQRARVLAITRDVAEAIYPAESFDADHDPAGAEGPRTAEGQTHAS